MANAEMKMPGVGVREESWLAQVAVSADTKLVSLAGGEPPAAGGVRREMVSTRVIEEFAMRLVRMWDPWSGD